MSLRFSNVPQICLPKVVDITFFDFLMFYDCLNLKILVLMLVVEDFFSLM